MLSGPSTANIVQGKSDLYKTEICKTWTQTQTCPHGKVCQVIVATPPLLQRAFSKSCAATLYVYLNQYAHGYDELHESPKIRHINHKTKQCLLELRHGTYE